MTTPTPEGDLPRVVFAEEQELCRLCEGNGVIKIPGGVSVCPRCRQTCYEPPTHSPPPAAPRPVCRECGRIVQQAELCSECIAGHEASHTSAPRPVACRQCGHPVHEPGLCGDKDPCYCTASPPPAEARDELARVLREYDLCDAIHGLEPWVADAVKAAVDEIAALRAQVQALGAWQCSQCGARFAESVPAIALEGVSRCSSCVKAEQATRTAFDRAIAVVEQLPGDEWGPSRADVLTALRAERDKEQS